ncbi:hypothetical protein Pcinc_007672 [Petrolisthes cinctipes]|uniref:Uncharacterized protein n=1 Tax=Petrolisthes cinctipes TaxID=88211 RepID=A0AAE1G803_PETCI|nr:hypothetical protein Pcinc_007672 [Petrolisthes cinctipes]
MGTEVSQAISAGTNGRLVESRLYELSVGDEQDRKSGILEILANTVERGVAQQTQKWKKQKQQQQQRHHHQQQTLRQQQQQRHRHQQHQQILRRRQQHQQQQQQQQQRRLTIQTSTDQRHPFRPTPAAAPPKPPVKNVLRDQQQQNKQDPDRGYMSDEYTNNMNSVVMVEPRPFALPSGRFVEVQKMEEEGAVDFEYYFDAPTRRPPPPRRGLRRRPIHQLSGNVENLSYDQTRRRQRQRGPEIHQREREIAIGTDWNDSLKAAKEQYTEHWKSRTPLTFRNEPNQQGFEPPPQELLNPPQELLNPPQELLNPRPIAWRGTGLNQFPSVRRPSIWPSLSSGNRNIHDTFDKSTYIFMDGVAESETSVVEETPFVKSTYFMDVGAESETAGVFEETHELYENMDETPASENYEVNNAGLISSSFSSTNHLDIKNNDHSISSNAPTAVPAKTKTTTALPKTFTFPPTNLPETFTFPPTNPPKTYTFPPTLSNTYTFLPPTNDPQTFNFPSTNPPKTYTFPPTLSNTYTFPPTNPPKTYTFPPTTTLPVPFLFMLDSAIPIRWLPGGKKGGDVWLP